MTRAITALAVLLLCQLLVAQDRPSLPPYAVKNAAVESIPLQPPSAPDPLRLGQTQLGRAGAMARHSSWRGFWAMTAAATALTVADIELSQGLLTAEHLQRSQPLTARFPRCRLRHSVTTVGRRHLVQLSPQETSSKPLVGHASWSNCRTRDRHRLGCSSGFLKTQPRSTSCASNNLR